VKNHLKETNSSISFEELVFSSDTSKRQAITPKKKKPVENDQPQSVHLDNSGVLHDEPNLLEVWSRKTVQNQTGQTAGNWDTYLYKYK